MLNRCGFSLLLLCCTYHHAQASNDLTYSNNLEDGFWISDYGSSIQLEGRLQYDWVNFKGLTAASQEQPFEQTTDHIVRRGNIGITGSLINVIPYEARIAYDRKTHEWDFDRAWLGFSGWQYANFYFGRTKFNWGLEGATSDSWTTSTERPVMYDLTSGTDDTDYGYTIQTSGTNYSFAIQAAKLQYDSDDENINTNFGYYSRLTLAPLLTSNQVLHIGLSYHDANPNHKNDTKIATRLETRSDNDDKIRFVEVNNTTKDQEGVFELAYQYQSLRLQGEYFSRMVKGDDIETKTKKGVTTTTIDPQKVQLDGGYVQLSYLIGSNRKYSVSEGQWGKPSQYNTFEPFVRYEYSNVNPNQAASKKQMNNNVDGVLAIDRYQDYVIKSSVVGINYFLNENLSFRFSYDHSKISNIDTSQTISGQNVKDTNDTFVARVQFVF